MRWKEKKTFIKETKYINMNRLCENETFYWINKKIIECFNSFFKITTIMVWIKKILNDTQNKIVIDDI